MGPSVGPLVFDETPTITKNGSNLEIISSEIEIHSVSQIILLFLLLLAILGSLCIMCTIMNKHTTYWKFLNSRNLIRCKV